MGEAGTEPTAQSAPWCSWNDAALRPSMPRGGICLLVSEDGLGQFDAPRNVDVCKSVTPKGASNPSSEDVRRIVEELHVQWGHAAVHHLKRNLVDVEWVHQCHSDCSGEVVGPR